MPGEVRQAGGSHSHVPEGSRPLGLQRVTSGVRKGPPCPQLLCLWPSEAAPLTPLLPSEQLTEERLAAPPPTSLPGIHCPDGIAASVASVAWVMVNGSHCFHRECSDPLPEPLPWKQTLETVEWSLFSSLLPTLYTTRPRLVGPSTSQAGFPIGSCQSANAALYSATPTGGKLPRMHSGPVSSSTRSCPFLDWGLHHASC